MNATSALGRNGSAITSALTSEAAAQSSSATSATTAGPTGNESLESRAASRRSASASCDVAIRMVSDAINWTTPCAGSLRGGGIIGMIRYANAAEQGQSMDQLPIVRL